MYRNDRIVRKPAAASDFPFWEVCGRWKSQGGSPSLRIYFTGRRHHRVEFAYDSTTVLRRPIFRKWGRPFFLMYGRIDLSYNAERDILTLSEYGDYIRAED